MQRTYEDYKNVLEDAFFTLREMVFEEEDIPKAISNATSAIFNFMLCWVEETVKTLLKVSEGAGREFASVCRREMTRHIEEALVKYESVH